jgi:hypothetical protein
VKTLQHIAPRSCAWVVGLVAERAGGIEVRLG